jgi:hypothetical protein
MDRFYRLGKFWRLEIVRIGMTVDITKRRSLLGIGHVLGIFLVVACSWRDYPLRGVTLLRHWGTVSHVLGGKAEIALHTSDMIDVFFALDACNLPLNSINVMGAMKTLEMKGRMNAQQEEGHKKNRKKTYNKSVSVFRRRITSQSVYSDYREHGEVLTFCFRLEA